MLVIYAEETPGSSPQESTSTTSASTTAILLAELEDSCVSIAIPKSLGGSMMILRKDRGLLRISFERNATAKCRTQTNGKVPQE